MDEKQEEPRTDEHVEDLDVTESESEDVKGGLSLNYSKIEMTYKPQKVDVDPAKWRGPEGRS